MYTILHIQVVETECEVFGPGPEHEATFYDKPGGFISRIGSLDMAHETASGSGHSGDDDV